MAKVWPVFEGREPTRGEPWADIPVDAAVRLFELRSKDYISDLENTPRFGDVRFDRQRAGYKLVVVEVDAGEGERANLKPGFYKSRVTPSDAVDKLIQHSLELSYGVDKVMRVHHEPTVSSQGDDALKIVVVLAPDAAKKIPRSAVLEAALGVQKRLQAMQLDRMPLIEYATEAELAQDAAS